MMYWGSWWHVVVLADGGLWLLLDIRYAYSHILLLLTITPQFICHRCSLHLFHTFSCTNTLNIHMTMSRSEHFPNMPCVYNTHDSVLWIYNPPWLLLFKYSYPGYTSPPGTMHCGDLINLSCYKRKWMRLCLCYGVNQKNSLSSI